MKLLEPISFVDLVSPHSELEDEIIESIRNIIRSGHFIGSRAVSEFESEFAQFCGTKHCIGVGSGTDALRFALIAAGVETDDIVLTVPNTFVATIEAILQSGAIPHFIDVDRRTFNISVAHIKQYLSSQCDTSHDGTTIHKISGRTVKAILPVHLYGQMCDMDSILSLAAQHRMLVLEDACQAHGAEYFSQRQQSWHRAGSMANAGAFSFYVAKNLGACGEAGAVTTNDDQLAERVRMIRDHGQKSKYWHVIEGYNGRLDALQAAILRVKLPHLAEWNTRRRKAAAFYSRLLGTAAPVQLPWEPSWSKSVYHLYVICTPQRDEVREAMAATQIDSGLHYPIPLHIQDAYAHLCYRRGDFPVAEQAATQLLSLPLHPYIERHQQERVAQAVLESCDRLSRVSSAV